MAFSHVVCLVLLSGSYAAPSAVGGASSPIAKVVVLIKEMKTQCAKDGEEDTAAYDKYKCWCETTEQEKTDAIAAAKAKLDELSGFLEEAAAKTAELKTEIAGLAADIAKDQDALESATSMRAKENKEFKAEEADAKETLGLLAEAISTLSKVQLMQKGSKPSKAALVQIRNVVKHISPKFPSVMQKDLYAMLGSLEEVEQQHLGSVFLPRNRAAVLEQSWKKSLPWAERAKSEEDIGRDAKPNAQNGAAAGAKSYNSRSGGILGLLKNMGDNTARDLASAQKEELDAEISFQSLQAAKMEEIAAATKQKDQKTVQLSDLEYKVANAKKDVEETTATLAADEEFLARTLDGCSSEDAEFAKRTKVRSQEIVALGETLDILTGDEARSLFDKTISFLQVGSVSGVSTTARQAKAKQDAMQRILAAAKKSKNWALASLAVKVNLDAFTKVKAAMDKMLGELKAQQKAEYEKGEQCKADLDKTEDKVKEATNTKEDLDQKHQELSNALETLSTEIDTLQKEVSDSEVALKQAGENRKADNQLYQQSVSDQRATIAVLNMAAARLKKFYTPGALVQIHAHAAPPPKPSANAYEKGENAGGVMQMLATIVADAQGVESELAINEQNEQKNYAEFAASTTASIQADRDAIAQKQEQSAQASGEKSETEESQLANDGSLAELNQLLTATHTDCDWILKYFDIRQQSRKDEMNAIEEAKAILSGANFA